MELNTGNVTKAFDKAHARH